jgi:hypothetical protein
MHVTHTTVQEWEKQRQLYKLVWWRVSQGHKGEQSKGPDLKGWGRDENLVLQSHYWVTEIQNFASSHGNAGEGPAWNLTDIYQ